MVAADPVLTIRNLRVSYSSRGRLVHAVKGVSLTLSRGTVFGLVGESGCGKSSTGLAIMGGAGGRAHVTGEVIYRGKNLLDRREHELRRLWGRRLAMVFQDSPGTLNPVLTVGKQVMEILQEHENCGRAEAWDRMVGLFESVHLPHPVDVAARYPHQLSGGQQQRIAIAMALACDPDVLVMDEPTTGLDVTTEARILDLVEALSRRSEAAILYISHNLSVIGRLCSEVAVMYAGEVVEQGPVDAIFTAPRHPYTVALLECLPRVDVPRSGRELPAIDGSLPDADVAESQCQFAPRCVMAEDSCRREHPPLAVATRGHSSRCFLWQRVSGPAIGQPAVRPADTRLDRPTPILCETRDLAHHYRQGHGLFIRMRRDVVKALDGVSLRVGSGETLAVVGESGSGKTTLARCMIGLLSPTRGEIFFDGRRLPSGTRWPRRVRRKLQIVFQNPDLTLNPRKTVLETLERPLRLFRLAGRRTLRARVAECLRTVRLGEDYLDRYPGELSGGERQRVAIARAFACEPGLVVCDEPTSALDVSVQAVVLNLLMSLQDQRGVGYLFISHDLSVVRHIADYLVILYLGKIVESGRAEDLFHPPHHPYTEALLSAVPRLLTPQGQGRMRLEGPAPNPAAPPAGCPFHPRCPRRIGAICAEEAPPLTVDDRGHVIACHIVRSELEQLQGARSPADGRD